MVNKQGGSQHGVYHRSGCSGQFGAAVVGFGCARPRDGGWFGQFCFGCGGWIALEVARRRRCPKW